MNQASLTSDGNYAADAIAHVYGTGHFKCLFSPQHGLWGEEQANMIETDHSWYALDVPGDSVRIPLFSLYSQTRAPTASMLAEIDVLVIDLQDVGTRVYTFIWTMLNCLEACAAHGKHVIILDRPNPLGGLQVEGRRLVDDYRSFVGLESLPMRHGLTMCELASWFKSVRKIDVELTLVNMQGWQRQHRYSESQRHWVCPSPNMPTYRTTCVYPGSVLLEGTNLSEGRGTTIPFEVVGAPFIDERALAKELNAHELPGIRFRPIRFRPTFDKWQGESCRGVYLDITSEQHFEAYRTMLHVLHAVRRLHGQQLEWLPPPYEYEHRWLPIDILTGDTQVRLAIDHQADLDQLDSLAATEPSWQATTRQHQHY